MGSDLKERIEYLDVIKGYAMILVAFCHYVLLPKESVLGNVLMLASWGAVPCFFMVTGGLMHRKQEFSWRDYVKKLVRTYFILCTWKIIYFISYSMLLDGIQYTKIELIKYVFLFQDIGGVNTGAMWFMYAYLTILLVYPISFFLFKGGKKGKVIMIWIAILCFTSSILITSVNLILEVLCKMVQCDIIDIVEVSKIIPFTSYSNMVFYFIMGAFILEKRFEISVWIKNRKGWVPSLLVIVGLCGLLLVKRYLTGSFFWLGIYLDDGYNRLFTMIFAIGGYLLLQNMKDFRVNRVIAKYVGRETLGIYYLHMLIMEILWKYYGAKVGVHYSLGVNLLKTGIVIVVCVLISRFMKKIPVMKKMFI